MKPKAEKALVFILWHTHCLPNQEEDFKLIGVYATKRSATYARKRAQKLPGFRKSPKGFQIDKYEIGKDHWTTGFVMLR